MELQKNLIPENILKTITVTSLEKNKFSDLIASVGFGIQSILDRPPIQMLCRIEGFKQKIEIFLALQLSKLKDAVNIDARLNLQDEQIPAIAAQLVEMYSVESLEDFVLCFKRGATGFYGSIYRLDAAVLNEWFRKYLDDKYSHIEAEVSKQKIETDKANEINYEEFKKRAGEFVKPQKQTNAAENEYQRRKLENPYRYFKVKNIEVYATSQQHAEELIQKMIDMGEIEIVNDEK